ncbi:hypothetical protein H9651_00275 [Microbacterium sp. Sa4CUA7]|uniref:Uncharacterized protein n=1 Tax=Microbacterium pullorum TaxID=2762236 RepID=A0ABR8RXW8_9MICO|nr:hypothetical protein [Microbacterium pullorum]MBD7956073.1 hypothetical protein [Microbacterium pullorum]
MRIDALDYAHRVKVTNAPAPFAGLVLDAAFRPGDGPGGFVRYRIDDRTRYALVRTTAGGFRSGRWWAAADLYDVDGSATASPPPVDQAPDARFTPRAEVDLTDDVAASPARAPETMDGTRCTARVDGSPDVSLVRVVDRDDHSLIVVESGALGVGTVLKAPGGLGSMLTGAATATVEIDVPQREPVKWWRPRTSPAPLVRRRLHLTRA